MRLRVRLEHQLNQVINGMSAMQANMTAMQARIDSIEGTLLIAMRSGFNSLQIAIDDIDYDLNIAEVQTERNARLNRKLHQRVAAIEARLDNQ